MDAFYAAVEQRDFPRYRNKAIIVGGPPQSRGVVATCSYEARQFGIHSAMPSARAYQLCPQAVFIKPRFEAYREASAEIRKIFAQFTDCLEPVSLDEAYLDVSNSSHCQGSATLIAQAIKQQIQTQTELIASAGISYNKFLAKIASDMDKPDGLYLITPAQGMQFIEQLPIGRFHGIGQATERKMHNLDIRNGKDLQQKSLTFLKQQFGKAGQHYYNIARGIDNRPVNNHRESKSVGVETTFAVDIQDKQVILENLNSLFQKALHKLDNKKMSAQTITIKVKYQNFVQITRSRTLADIITADSPVSHVMEELLSDTQIETQKVRLLGVTLSTLKKPELNAYRQLDLFSNIFL